MHCVKRPTQAISSLSEALEHEERMRPARTILTNLHTDLDYGKLKAPCRTHHSAFDGMIFEA